ncbi:MAG TPA: hypothetical protein VMH27_10105 [Puia sp.]|nr:hypothetical protein [Puia sp.]
MKRNLLMILTVLIATSARSQRWQQRVNYSIDVTLTDSTHSLDGNVSIHYINHSPDTLSFIWIQCWPNAFKNDRTAFSEALIREGRTDFYFSDISRKGYINRLEFRADGRLARMEDHPRFIDVIRVVLPSPLAPGDSVTLSTPFHVQLPDNFAGFGYRQGVYAVTQWYPRAAVFDGSGWHPDPFLGRDDSYHEFGDFDVRIVAPEGIAVVAGGLPVGVGAGAATGAANDGGLGAGGAGAGTGARVWRFHQSNVPDFVWFASRRFRSVHDTLQLPCGRVIDVNAYFGRANSPTGRYGLRYLKDAIRFCSDAFGDYPFDAATIVETRAVPEERSGPEGARAAYPGIVIVDSRDSAGFALDMTVECGIAGQWLAVATGADAHRYPWMTKGIGQFYYDRYRVKKYWPPHPEYFDTDTFFRSGVNTRVVLKEDQPVSTSSEDFTPGNYRIIAGDKTAIWLLELERGMGPELYGKSMRIYLDHAHNRHVGPGDLKAAFGAAGSGINIDSAFALLDTTGPVPPSPYHRTPEPNIQLIPHPTHRNRLNISPAIGFNNYDHWMAGVLIHNYNLPPEHWQLLAAPMYATGSHQWNGVAHFNYAWYPRQNFRLMEAGINGSRFSTMSGTDSSGHAIFGGVYKIVPYFRLFFPRSSPASTRTVELEAKAYLIGEKSFDNYVLKSTDSLPYPVAGKFDFRYLNQLSFTMRDERVLYPYSVNVQGQQAASWYRVNLDIHYFFNYSTVGGLDVRLFGAKFGYLGGRNPAEDLTPYEPKLTAVRGNEDYTYGNYFIGRNDFNGLASQQIMLRDGDLKLRTDLFQSLQGRSDDWVAAVNLNSTLPGQIVPGWLPLHLFLDIGTYAQAWSDNPATGHFLYVGGFELSFFHDVLRIYAPLVYSSDFGSQLKTVAGQNGFFQKISFSIDAGNIPFRKWFGYTPF